MTERDLLQKLEKETCDLRCVADSEESYHWEVISHWQNEPTERVEGYGATCIAALLNAFNKPKEM